MSNYLWNVSGGTITSGGGTGNSTATVTWTSAGSQSVSVNYTSGSGCQAGSPTSTSVTVYAAPVPSLTGSTTPCKNSTGNVYTTNGGMTGYTWSVSAGGTITAGGTSSSNTVTITWNTAGNQTVSVNYTNASGCAAASPTVLAISVIPIPVPTITGAISPCTGAIDQDYSTEAGMSNYTWAVSAGGTITSGGTSNSHNVTVTWNTNGPQTVSVGYTNAYGCVSAAPTVLAVTVNPQPVPVINGYSTVYAGTAGVVYSTVAGMTSYNWSITSPGTITAGQGTNSITVSWGGYPVCGCASLSLAVNNNGCSGSADYPITVLPASNVKIFGLMSYNNNGNTRMNGVTVKLYNSANLLVGTTLTSNNPDNGQAGFYEFLDLPYDTYTLRGSYNGPWGGNNATDALIVQLYIVGSYQLGQMKTLAADVNSSNSITALDALYIKLRTVGSISSYPGGDWKFADTTVTYSGPSLSVDLKMICNGDVNGSYSPVTNKQGSFLSVIEDGVISIPVGEPFVYNILSSRDADLGAMTLFMGYDKEHFEVTDVASKLEGLKYVVGDGSISVAWSDTKSLKVHADDVVLSLNMISKDKLSVPSRVFDIKSGSEFADILANPYENFDLKMADVITPDGNQDITLFNYPNPFNKTTTIVYTVPASGHTRLILTDLVGNTVGTLADRQDKAGSHTVTVDPAAMHMASGVYLYKIIFDTPTDTYVKVNKMVLTK